MDRVGRLLRAVRIAIHRLLNPIAVLLGLVFTLGLALLLAIAITLALTFHRRPRRPPQPIHTSIPPPRPRIPLIPILILHDKDTTPNPQQLIPAKLGRHLRQDIIRLPKRPPVPCGPQVQQAWVHLLREPRLGLAVNLVEPRRGQRGQVDVARLGHDGGVLVLVREHGARVEDGERVLPVLHGDVDLREARPGAELARRRDGAAVGALAREAEPLIALLGRRGRARLLQEELGLRVEHGVVHGRLLEGLVERLDAPDLLVAHEEDLGEEGGHLDVLGAQLLEEVDARGVAAGGLKVAEEAGGEVVGDVVGDLHDGVGAELPACGSQWGSQTKISLRQNHLSDTNITI